MHSRRTSGSIKVVALGTTATLLTLAPNLLNGPGTAALQAKAKPGLQTNPPTLKKVEGEFSVADRMNMPFSPKAGEAQSVVIPPGKKAQCPAGRLLISNDNNKNLSQGAVRGRDLDKLDGPASNDTLANFQALPSSDYAIAGNDHDLVALNNGDLIYVRAIRIKAALDPKPAWFDCTYRVDWDNNTFFGPGARSGLGVWRSEDGGGYFSLVKIIDSAKFMNGIPAMPQWPRNTKSPGSLSKPIFDMGGSDGPTTKVDMRTNEIFIAFACVGYEQDTSVTSHFELSTKPLARTLMLKSTNRGSSWSTIGFANNWRFSWRTGLIPFYPNRLAHSHGFDNEIKIASKLSNGLYSLNTGSLPAPIDQYGYNWNYSDISWGGKDAKGDPIPKTGVAKFIGTNVYAHTILFRCPPSNSLAIAYPSWIPPSGNGYYLFFFNSGAPNWTEAPPILPVVPGGSNFIMHLTAIDLGEGPALLYWNDIKGKNFEASVRGRLVIKSGQCTSDFSVGRKNGLPDSWKLNGSYWYGDYHTASGYIEQPTAQNRLLSPRYHYYPIWIEPDQTVSFTEVICQLPLPTSKRAVHLDPKLLQISRRVFKAQTRSANAVKPRLSRTELDRLEDHNHGTSGAGGGR